MSVTSNNISALYITMFNRVPEGAGHKFWLDLANKQGLNVSQVAEQMLNSAPAKEYFAGKNADADFVNHIYSNLFGKTSAEDPVGSKFWVDKLKEGNSKAFIVSQMLDAATNNKYTKPEELKAQNLFLNKVKAAEIAYKAIENVPSSGTITEKIAGFAAVLKNIKDTSTPTQIAQVIKQEAMKANLTVLSNKELAQITKSVFPSVDASAAEKALDATTATTDIYANTPAPTPTPTPGGGGSSGGGSGSGSTPLTPEQKEQKAREEAVKQAEKNLEKAKEEAKQAQTDKLVANYVKDAVKDSVDNHSGIRQDALNYIQSKIDDPSTTEAQKEALEKAKEIVKTFAKTLDEKKLVEVTGEAAVADRTKDVADKQEKLAEDQAKYAEAVVKEIPLFNAAQKAYDDKLKAESEKVVATGLKTAIDANTTVNAVKAAIEGSLALTYEQKVAAKAQLDVWAKELGLKSTDDYTARGLIAKADENQTSATDKASEATKAYHDTGIIPNTGALPNYLQNKVFVEGFEKDVSEAKAGVATAVVALREAEEKAAKDNLDKDADNNELKETWEKAKAELEKAKAEEKSAKITEKAAALNTVELKKVGETSVYKSEDGKYTVDLGSDVVTEGKTLVVAKEDNKLHEIDASTADLTASESHTGKALLKTSDKGGTVYKGGVEQFSFFSKDGNAVAAVKGANEGFILKPGVKADYDTMSKAEFDYGTGKFKVGTAEQQAYKIETTKTVLDHDKDNPKFEISKVKALDGTHDYEFTYKPILDNTLDFKVKDVNGVKVPVINGKMYDGIIDGHTIDVDDNDDLQSITKDSIVYNFDADGKVKSIVKGAFTYALKADGHKALNDAIALAAGAQDDLNKASSDVLQNQIDRGEVFRLDNDGKVKSILLLNNNELTAKTPLSNFAPDDTILNALLIEKIKIADNSTEFALTDNPRYDAAKMYKMVPDKPMLKSGDTYINSTYDQSGTHKFTVTNGAANKYTLTETEGSNTISVEKLEGGITKTVDANGVKLAGTKNAVDDTITVEDDQTTTANVGASNKIGVETLNTGKVSFDSIEKVEIKTTSDTMSHKGFTALYNAVKNGSDDTMKLINDLTLKSTDGGDIELHKLDYNTKKLTINLKNADDSAANGKADTIGLGNKVGTLEIKGFDATQDKLYFKGWGGTDSSTTQVPGNAERSIENGKIYTTDAGGTIGGKNYAGAEFGELFASGKAFSTNIAVKAKSVVAVKGTDETKLLSVYDEDSSGTIENTEVHLIGTLIGDVNLTDANIAAGH